MSGAKLAPPLHARVSGWQMQNCMHCLAKKTIILGQVCSVTASTNVNVLCSFINMTTYAKSINIIAQFASSTTVLLKFVTEQNLTKGPPTV